MSIFREEVLYGRRPEIQGDVSLALPRSWHYISLLFALVAILLMISLFSISYTRVEKVTGELVWSGGVVEVQASSPGRVDQILISEGQTVNKGDPLVTIRTEASVDNDPGNFSGVLDSLVTRRQIVEDNLSTEKQLFEAGSSQVLVRISFLRKEIGSLEQQKIEQRTLVESAEQNLEQAEAIAERGFVSQRDLADRQDILIQRRQRLKEIEQNIFSLRSELEQARIEQDAISARWQSSKNDTASNVALLDEEVAQASRNVDYIIAAPVAGSIAAVTSNVGSIAGPDRSIMYIRPKDRELIAEIYVPSEIVGKLHEGQLISLEFDGYSADRATRVEAHIVSLSATPVSTPQELDPTDSGDMYLVRAKPTRREVVVGGEAVKLRSGANLTLLVPLEKKSLARWLFDPLLGMR